MKIMSAVVVFISSFGSMQGRPAPSGIELVVKVEARRLAGQDVTAQATRIIESELPGGSAEVKYLTDGQAVRSTAFGRVFGLEAGTVRLVPRGSPDLYVLNPLERTYKQAAANSKLFAGQKPEFHFKPTGRSKTILGYKAQEVAGWYRVELPPFPGEDQHVRELRVDIDNWCNSTLDIPRAMTRMMDVTQRLVGGDVEYHKTCPLALQSAVNMSVLPGYEIVSVTQSIRRPSQFPPETFRLPAGYRQIRNEGRGMAESPTFTYHYGSTLTDEARTIVAAR